MTFMSKFVGQRPTATPAPPPAPEEQPRYHPGDLIGGRFHVYQVLRGGMGEVYLCLDLQDDMPFALKTFQQQFLGDSRVFDNFQHEVATWVALESHPNIVRCFYMDYYDNIPFMLLEWVAGEEDKGTDLQSWLRHGPLDMRLALDVMIHICNGLIHANQKQPGIVHRDLKPANVLVAQSRVAKITDFGLAAIIQNTRVALTPSDPSSGALQSIIGANGAVGTPLYMAPEQWAAGKVDARTDIYAMGCILYQVLTARPPYLVQSSNKSLEQIFAEYQYMHEQAGTPRVPDHIPMASYINRVINQCMMKSPSDRPSSVEEVLQALTWIYQQQYQEAPRKPVMEHGMIASNYNSRGLTYIALGRNREALEDLNRAIELEPLPSFYSNRGAALHNLERYQEALADYDYAIAQNPTDGTIYTNRAITYMMIDEYEAALADYNRAIQLNPARPKPHTNRGILLAAMGRIEDALADMTQAIRIDPNYVGSYIGRGTVLLEQGRFEEALEDFTRAMQFDPHNDYIYHQTATIYLHLDRYEEAIACYTRAIEFNPSYAEPYSHRASIYMQQGRQQEALADLNRAIELNPNDVGSYINRSNIYGDMQRMPEALNDLTCAIQISPDMPGPHLAMGLMLFQLRQFAEAQPHFEFIVQHPMQDPVLSEVATEHLARIRQLLSEEHELPEAEVCLRRGYMLLNDEQYEAAFHEVKRALQLDAYSGKAYYLRGLLYQHTGQLEAALADLTRAIQLKPDHALSYFLRGDICESLQRYDQALADFNTGLALDSSHTVMVYKRAELLRTMEHYAEAFDDYSTVIAREPTSNTAFLAYTQRAILLLDAGEYALAVEDLSHAIGLEPHISTSYKLRGDAYARLQRSGEALADYNRAIQMSPDSSWAYLGRARLYRAMQRYDVALNDYHQAIQYDPRDIAAYYERGTLWTATGYYENAMDDFLVGLDLAEAADNTAAMAHMYMAMGYLCIEVEEYQQAMDCFDLADSLGHPDASTELARLRQRRG